MWFCYFFHQLRGWKNVKEEGEGGNSSKGYGTKAFHLGGEGGRRGSGVTIHCIFHQVFQTVRRAMELRCPVIMYLLALLRADTIERSYTLTLLPSLAEHTTTVVEQRGKIWRDNVGLFIIWTHT